MFSSPEVVLPSNHADGPDVVLLACVLRSRRGSRPVFSNPDVVLMAPDGADGLDGANACARLDTAQLTVPTIGLCKGTRSEPSASQNYCGHAII